MLAVALLLGVRGRALAHAALVRAEPAAGSRLTTVPARVRLVFSEPLEPTLARLTLVPAGGSAIPLAAAGDPHDVYAIVAPLAALAPGRYRVDWRVVSADGHPVQGSLAFSVAEGATPSSTGPPAGTTVAAPPAPTSGSGHDAMPDDPSHPMDAHARPTHAIPTHTMPAGAMDGAMDRPWGPSVAGAPLVPAVVRGLADAALAALAGVLTLAVLRPRAAAGGAPTPRAVHRLALGLAVGAPVLLALHLAAWMANIAPDHHLTGAWIGASLATTPGRVELWRGGLAVLALWALGLARRPGLALAFAAAAVLASGALGHPAALRPAVAIPAKALHLAGVALWLGGLLWLLAVLAAGPLAGPPSPALAGPAHEGLARDAGRVSVAALAAAVLVALTGVVQAWAFLPGPAALTHSAYGVITLAKAAGFVALAAFGAYHRYRVLPRLTGDGVPGRFAASLRREIVVMVLVTLLGGVLAYVPTPAT